MYLAKYDDVYGMGKTVAEAFEDLNTNQESPLEETCFYIVGDKIEVELAVKQTVVITSPKRK